jgi:hypothetical protein
MSAHRVQAALVAPVLAALAFLVSATAQAPAGNGASEPYTWKNVQMVGGGFVDGIVFHPTAKGVRYARTDMGGAYRWNGQTRLWQPLLDWVGYEESNLMGVESIAVDPADANRVYLACGTYTTSPVNAILRSSDRGKTFERIDVPIRFGGNEDGRGNGERMTVDPNNGSVLYLGTRQNGLWRSQDGAKTWKQVDSFPDVTEAAGGAGAGRGSPRGDGIVVTLVDPHSGSKGKTSSAIYAAVSLMGRDNLFRSIDSGKTWQPVAGQPTQYRPTHMVMAADGTLYLSYGTSPGPSRMTAGGVWKLDTRSGAWTDVTPAPPDSKNPAFGWAAVSVDAHNPKVAIASTYGRGNSAGGEDEIFRTIDGGKTWKAVFASGGTFDYKLAPYTATTPIHWIFDIEIDPADPNHAMFTTGYGGWETFNLADMDAGKPTRWSIMANGIEQTAELEMASPTKGAHLLSAIGDYGGFVHWDLDKPAPEGASSPPVFNNTGGIAYAENKPEVIVRVGVCSHHHLPGFNISYSLDSGRTWQPPATQPAALPSAGGRGGGAGRGPSGGDIAISSDGATWVWISRGAAPSLTTDKGATWTGIKGLPGNMHVIADRVNPRKFYAVSPYEGKLFISTDGAANFAEQAFTLPGGLPTRSGARIEGGSGWDRIYATPGREGDLWLTALNGLYHSADTGRTFTRVEGVTELRGFGFGKAAPGASDPALYLVGVANGRRGILRSDDWARTWVRINDDRRQFGLIGQITGDPKLYGRVYVGTFGRGILYGDPARKF